MKLSNLSLQYQKYWLTDGGLETWLIYHKGVELPQFASFTVLETPGGRQLMADYFKSFYRLAASQGFGYLLDTLTWRASPDWLNTMGYGEEALERINREAVKLALDLRTVWEPLDTPVFVAGTLGPRHDGYRTGTRMSAAEAHHYHKAQVSILAAAGADLVSAMTLNYTEEGAGVALAAREAGIPVLISFTVETDGNLPGGESLEDAIAETDALSGRYPMGYMINCAHPTHFLEILENSELLADRLIGVRANASCKSHAELDESTELDEGDPQALASWYPVIAERLPRMRIAGGCCGTDLKHLKAVGEALSGINS